MLFASLACKASDRNVDHCSFRAASSGVLASCVQRIPRGATRATSNPNLGDGMMDFARDEGDDWCVSPLPVGAVVA